jgi:UDP-N-acetylmuramate dehydrogenase
VVDLRSFDSSIEKLKNGQFKVGASTRLQKLINTINEHGYGGIEYLYSVPGLVGGAVVMNASRGREYQKFISDYIVSVVVIHNNELITISKDNCHFGYRDSIF